MSQSNIEVQMVTFRPNGTGNCLVEMVPDDDFAGNPPTDGHLTVPTSYKIRLKRKAGLHKVKFSIVTSTTSANPNERYLLLGIYFINRDTTVPGEIVGQHVFKKYTCNVAANPPTLLLNITRDAITKREQYEFMLLVQRLSDGALGVIDPEWENE